MNAPVEPSAKTRPAMRISMRTAIELVMATAAVLGVWLSYIYGEREGQSALRDVRMDAVTVIEAVSRYMSMMSGYATLDSKERKPYSEIAGRVRLEEGVIDQNPGIAATLEINQPVVLTLINLAKIVNGDSNPAGDSTAETAIASPLKAFSVSIDPTIVAGSLITLEGMRNEQLIKYQYDDSPDELREFESSSFNMVSIKGVNSGNNTRSGLDFSKVLLAAADFRHAKITNVKFNACLLSRNDSSANFSKSRLEGVTIAGCDKEENITHVDMSNAKLVSGSGSGLILDGGFVLLKLSGLETIGEAGGILCKNATVVIEKMDEAKLQNSIFEYCTFRRFAVPDKATLEGAKFVGANIIDAKFGRDTLSGAKISAGDASRAYFAFTGISMDGFSRDKDKAVNITNAVFEQTNSESLLKMLNQDEPIFEIDENQRIFLVKADNTGVGEIIARQGQYYVPNPNETVVQSAVNDVCDKHKLLCEFKL